MTEYLKNLKCSNYELPSKKYGSYYTIREGFRYLTVDYTKDSIKIYKNLYLDKNNKKENKILEDYLTQSKKYEIDTVFSDDDNLYFFPKLELIMEIKKFSNVWLGFDTEYKFRTTKYIGNTFLIQISANIYIYIESDSISKFSLNEQILKYFSPLDDETVAEPVALTKNKLILFIGNEIKVYSTKDIDNVVMSAAAKEYRNDPYYSEKSPLIYTSLYYNDFFKDIHNETIILSTIYYEPSIESSFNNDSNISLKNRSTSPMDNNSKLLIILIVVLLLIVFLSYNDLLFDITKFIKIFK